MSFYRQHRVTYEFNASAIEIILQNGVIKITVLTNIVVQISLTVNTCISTTSVHDTESLFLFRKIILSTHEDDRRLRSFISICPTLENIRPDGTDVSSVARYRHAKIDIRGYSVENYISACTRSRFNTCIFIAT
jgi:hypothetical protein